MALKQNSEGTQTSPPRRRGQGAPTKAKPTAKNNNKKQKKKNGKKKVNGWMLLLRILLLAFIIALISGLSLIASTWGSTGDVSDDNFWITNTATKVYDRNDKEIAELSPHSVDWVHLKDDDGNYLISESFINGLIATEDAKFYEHNGVDILGLVKGVFATAFTNSDRGGSTLTMQLAKLIYMPEWEQDNNQNGVDDEGDKDGIALKNDHPIKYKLTQMVYAYKIEAQYSKDEILENYANTVYFGSGGYGIKNASEHFFGVTPDKLSLSQGAMLAGMQQSPYNYDPYVDMDAATSRRNIVLDRMLTVGSISQEEHDKAKKEKISATLLNPDDAKPSTIDKYSGYLGVIYSELNDKFGDVKGFNPTTAGIEIHTNLDPELQERTYDVENTNDYFTYEQDSNIASVTLDTQTGGVLAVGPGKGYILTGDNRATATDRSPGSTSKPLVDYAPAIEFLKWSTHHQIDDKKISYDDTKKQVNNWDDAYKGPMTIEDALAESRNTTALATFKEVTKEVGVDKVEEFLAGLGISDSKDINQAYSIGGWDTGTSPMEMAGAYAAFGNGGTYYKPTAIRYVNINQNSILYDKFGDRVDFTSKGTKAMEPETAYLMMQMLNTENAATAGVSDEANTPGLDEESLKTGTSNWSGDNPYGFKESDPRDKWVVGFTPDATTAVWTGYNGEEEKQGKNVSFTNHDSYKAYVSIMEGVRDSAEEYLDDDDFEMPDNVEAIKVVNKQWPARRSVRGTTHYFIKDSDEYKNISGNSVVNTKVPQPIVKTSLYDATVHLTWDYRGSKESSAKWNIYIDGNKYKTVKSKSLNIPFDEFAKHSTCKQKYDLGIELVDSSGTSAITTLPLTFDGKYC